MRTGLIALSLCTAVVCTACHSHPRTVEQRDSMQDDIRTEAAATLSRLEEIKPGSHAQIERAAGYAVFTDFGARLLVVGTARGKGIAVDSRTGGESYMRMTEVSAGLGPSVKKFDLVWVFTSREAFEKFVEHGWQFQAVGTAAAKAGEHGGAYEGAVAIGPDVYVYQLTDAGLALELTLKGAKFYHDKGLD